MLAQIDVHWSNSMAEAVNKQIKYNYLFRKELFDFNDTVKHLEFAVNEHNFRKPLAVLKGLRPFESYSCMEPDIEKYRLDIENARQKRLEYHRKITCLNHEELKNV